MIKTIYDAGISNIVYWTFLVLGFLISMVFSIIIGKKYNITYKRGFFCFWSIYIFFSIILLVILPIIEINVAHRSRISTKVFVYMPIGCFIASKIFKIKWHILCDITAFCMCLLRMISHIGCMFEGCCGGIISDFGIYSPRYKTTVFPMQILDIIVMSVIFIILILIAKKQNYKSKGIFYPIMLISYGTFSFSMDFLRISEKIWQGFSAIAYHGLFMVVIGIILLICVLCYNRKYYTLKKEEAK